MADSSSKGSEFDKYNEPELHMKRLLDTHLVNTDIPIRILILLESAGIKRIGDLTSSDRERISSIRQIGRGSMKVIENTLHRYGLYIGMNKKGCLPTAD